MEAERVAREGRWLSYPGPVQLTLSRPTPHTPWLCEEEPDDDIAYDLTVPPSLHVSFPRLPDPYGATGFVDQEWDCTTDACADISGIVNRVDELIALTRRESIAESRPDAICGWTNRCRGIGAALDALRVGSPVAGGAGFIARTGEALPGCDVPTRTRPNALRPSAESESSEAFLDTMLGKHDAR